MKHEKTPLNELKVKEDGITTIARFDHASYRIVVQSQTASSLYFRSMYSMQMIHDTKAIKPGESPLEFAMRMHKAHPDFEKLKPDITHASPGDIVSIKINVTPKKPFSKDLAKVKMKIEELVKQEIPQAAVDMDIKKVLGSATFHTGGVVKPKPLTKEQFMKQADKVYGLSKNSGKFLVDYSTNPYVKELANVFKGLDAQIKHPETGTKATLSSIIVNLNDDYGWSRNQIADWIESLDVDTSMVPEAELVKGE